MEGGATRQQRRRVLGRAIRVAGLVVALLIGAVAAADLVSFTTSHDVHPVVLRLGETASTPGVTVGVRSATVFAFVYPATATDGSRADPTYALADIQECAGSGGLPKASGPKVGPDALARGWEVNFDPGTQGGGRVAGAAPVLLRVPVFPGDQAIAPNKCARGWLAFEVDGTRPFFVSFEVPYTFWRVGP